MAGEAGEEVDEDRIPGRTAKILCVTGKLRQDLKSGNQAAVATDRLDLKRDRQDLRKDRWDRRADRRDLHRDVRDLRRDRRDIHRDRADLCRDVRNHGKRLGKR